MLSDTQPESIDCDSHRGDRAPVAERLWRIRMKHLVRVVAALCLPVFLLGVTRPVHAQAKTASQFYMEWRKAFDTAKKMEDLLPWMSADVRKQMESTPPGDRAEIFGMIKIMGALSNVKITKETANAKGATLTVEALDGDKAKTTGTVDIVKEGTAWKIGKESFKSGPS
jgi:hypothetical protein